MNKEELLYQIATLEQENKQLKEQIIDYSYKLSHFASEETYEKEIKQLQERIDKALNLVNKCEEDLLINSNWLKELLDVLKGE